MKSGRTLRSNASVNKPKRQDLVKIGLVNAQSCRKKTTIINDFRNENKLHINMIVEAWVKDDETRILGELKKDNWDLQTEPRPNREGGGLLFAYRKGGSKVKKNKTISVTTMEVMEITVNINSILITFVLLYRPQPSNMNKYKVYRLSLRNSLNYWPITV